MIEVKRTADRVSLRVPTKMIRSPGFQKPVQEVLMSDEDALELAKTILEVARSESD